MTGPMARLSGALAAASLLLLAAADLSAQDAAAVAPQDAPAEAPQDAPANAPGPDSADAPAAEPEPRFEAAVLQGLDKITARISTFEAPVEEIARFGSLQITTRTCHKRPPEEPPESAAFLEIVDVRPDSAAVEVFTGWMFASSPALSAMEHPVYDVWVIDCKKAASSESVSSEGN
jgi:hypothetical protein